MTRARVAVGTMHLSGRLKRRFIANGHGRMAVHPKHEYEYPPRRASAASEYEYDKNNNNRGDTMPDLTGSCGCCDYNVSGL